MRFVVASIVLFFTTFTVAKENLIVVTIDGLRWQEVFGGADKALIEHKDFVAQPEQLKAQFWAETPEKRRELLMPFFWKTLINNGSAIGNRNLGSNMSVANNWHFSYPGYNEIFTGIADDKIDSNEKRPNPNISFIEFLNNRPEFGGNLAIFAGWDVFPAIFNVERSGLHVNAGFMPSKTTHTPETTLLNQLQQEIPSPWHNVRYDAFTYRFAKNYILANTPRVLAIGFGETDDFAHDGRYDQYLHAAHRTDKFIQDLWQTIQSLPKYQNQTTLLITTDHGRGGNPEQWQHHASRKAISGYLKSLGKFPKGILGSEQTWLVAIGPGIKSKGQVIPAGEIRLNQIAATALKILDLDPDIFNPDIGSPIQEIFSP